MQNRVLLVVALTLFAGAAFCQPAVDAGQRWMRARIAWAFLSPQPRSNVSFDEARRFAEDVFAVSAAGEAAVTRETLERARRPLMASARALILAGAYRLDTNFDGVLDRDELERGGRRECALGLGPGFVAALREADANGDGRVDITEILALARRWIEERRPPFDRFEPWLEDFVPLTLDRDGGGRVTREAFDQAVREAFVAIDTDGDGRLSEAELRAATAGTSNPIVRTLLSP